MTLSLSCHNYLGQKDKSMTRVSVFAATKMGNMSHFRAWKKLMPNASLCYTHYT